MSPDDMALRTLLSEAVAASDPSLRDRLRTDPAAYLDLVTLNARARSEAGVLLTLAVAGARSAGCTWEAIGGALGLTGSDAQRRYEPASPDPADPDPAASAPAASDPAASAPAADTGAAERTQALTRLTTFTEMAVLENAGRYGWHLVGSGTATLIVRTSTEQWEHRRVFASRARGRALEQDGWTRCGELWFPWAYFKRPTGRPALPDPLDGSDLRSP